MYQYELTDPVCTSKVDIKRAILSLTFYRLKNYIAQYVEDRFVMNCGTHKRISRLRDTACVACKIPVQIKMWIL